VYWAGFVNYLQTRACGARKGSFVAYFAGYARKIRNKRTKKAREVGLAQRKTNNSQALPIKRVWLAVLVADMVCLERMFCE
jgi:membrane protein YqaA with SNARE-associated domain